MKPSLFLLSLLLFPGGTPPRKSPPPDPTALVRKRLARKVPVPKRRVLAFYYPWYHTRAFSGRQRHWGKWDPLKKDAPLALRWPEEGPYDSLDPKVVRRHLDLARAAGIDTLVSSWWGKKTDTDRVLPLLLEEAARRGMNVTIYYETVPGKPPSPDRAARDLLHLGKKYASHKAWLKVGGKPVFFLYGRALLQLGSLGWVRALDAARRAGGPDWIVLADGLKEEDAALFDGIHTYNPLGTYRGGSPEQLPALAEGFMKDLVRLARSRGRIACATVLPGYDDTKIRKPGARLDRLGGKLYEIQWKAALEARPDWVVITSFNEWHEGSEIEPSLQLGRKYMDATARWAEAFKKLPPPRWNPGEAGKDPAPLENALGRVKGKIGILGGMGGTAITLLEAGARAALVGPEDLAAGRIDPGEYPLLVYGGGESYRFTVKKPGDVPDALGAYLSRGGALLVLPSGPYPFYYDSGGRVVRAGERFGLLLPGAPGGKAAGPVDFESPPRGARLVFHLSPLLRRQPRSLPFPRLGDLRWRAALPPARPGPGESYLSLARLTGARGKPWGDGIALFRRPGGGRILYAWFRFGDMLPRGPLLADFLEILFP